MGRGKLPSSLEDVHLALGLPADYMPATAEEADFFYERAIDLLKAPTISKYMLHVTCTCSTCACRYMYMCVTPAGKRWQAKVTARGHQVILGSWQLQPGQRRCISSADVLHRRSASAPLT